MAAQTDIVAEFIKELVPKDVVEAAQLLVSLDYPIPDKKSLILQLEQRKTNSPQDQKAGAESSRLTLGLIEYVAGVFKPVDFGLDTPQSALEKFFARTSQDCSCSSLPDLRPRGLPDLPGGEPSPFLPTTPEQINLAFDTDACGRAAAQRWRRHMDYSARRRLPLSVAEFDEIRNTRLPYCRGYVRSLRLRGSCGVIASDTLARCLVNVRTPDIFSARACTQGALREYEVCIAALPRFYDPFGGGEPPPGF